MTVVIGTSGWLYRDWRGRFYPPGLPQRLELEHHAAHFATVESNNAFYRLPERSTFERWRDRSPDDYRWAVKASRFLTHMKRLRDPAEPVARLMERVAGLGAQLDVVLLQLPPTLKADLELLSECLGQFPAGTRIAVEPRHESWWTDEVRGLLERYEAALCWADRGEQPVTPLWRTAEWGYLRLHRGIADGVDGWAYRPATLRGWADRVVRTYGEDQVLVYTNNDPGGAGVNDAVVFADAVRKAGGVHTRVPTADQASGAAWPPKPPRKRQRTARSSASDTPS